MNCPEGCSAPIYPEDESSLKNAIWYPDEPICPKRGLNLSWLKIQKRIARKAKDKDRYFTFKDFQVLRVRSPRGHNPDKPLPQYPLASSYGS